MYKLLLTALLVTNSIISTAGNKDWELGKDESGIKVYTRTVEGEDICEFKAITEINAPREKVVNIVKDVDSYTQWYPDISVSKVLKKISSNSYYVYSVIDLPWPADDRDGVSKMTIEEKESVTTIKMRAAEGVKAEKSGYVRIKKSYGFWIFKSNGSKTSVHFQYFANPAGSLPDWMINMFIVDNPFETLKNLKARATK